MTGTMRGAFARLSAAWLAVRYVFVMGIERDIRDELEAAHRLGFRNGFGWGSDHSATPDEWEAAMSDEAFLNPWGE
jgi:ribosome modulation factor